MKCVDLPFVLMSAGVGVLKQGQFWPNSSSEKKNIQLFLLGRCPTALL